MTNSINQINLMAK